MTTVIAIDGPSASGKSAVGRLIAVRLGFAFLDSGLIYRAIALAAARSSTRNIDEVLEHLRASLTAEALDALLSDPDLALASTGQYASQLAVLPAVRHFADELQRKWAASKNAVIVGRDIGTTVFPDAPFKFYITASLMVRAMRRWQQLADLGSVDSVEEVAADLAARDARDEDRACSPMCAAPDACLIDTSDLSMDEVVAQVVSMITLGKNR